ncbi:MAG: hypothetical protein IPJ82_11760 [Lewinellaceae bacterium]|nr:hypothetical protein [Lewinellaceae bacterium]
MNFLPAHRLRLYRNFKALEVSDFHGIIRFYEQFEDGIRALDFEEYFDCTEAYTNALFQTGNHGKHVVMCDHLLEIIIMQNVETWGGEDLYAKTLFLKAASLYQMHEYPKAEHVLRELVKIYPADRLPCRFLEKCLLRQKPAWLMKTRAATVVIVLLTAAVIAGEIFIVQPFWPSRVKPVMVMHNVLLGLGILVFVAGVLFHALRCRHAAGSFARRMFRRKAGG